MALQIVEVDGVPSVTVAQWVFDDGAAAVADGGVEAVVNGGLDEDSVSGFCQCLDDG